MLYTGLLTMRVARFQFSKGASKLSKAYIYTSPTEIQSKWHLGIIVKKKQNIMLTWVKYDTCWGYLENKQYGKTQNNEFLAYLSNFDFEEIVLASFICWEVAISISCLYSEGVGSAFSTDHCGAVVHKPTFCCINRSCGQTRTILSTSMSVD